MRGNDANDIICVHEAKAGPIADRDARVALVSAIAEAIEQGYRDGLTAGITNERKRMRKVLGL